MGEIWGPRAAWRSCAERGPRGAPLRALEGGGAYAAAPARRGRLRARGRGPRTSGARARSSRGRRPPPPPPSFFDWAAVRLPEARPDIREHSRHRGVLHEPTAGGRLRRPLRSGADVRQGPVWRQAPGLLRVGRRLVAGCGDDAPLGARIIGLSALRASGHGFVLEGGLVTTRPILGAGTRSLTDSRSARSRVSRLSSRALSASPPGTPPGLPPGLSSARLRGLPAPLTRSTKMYNLRYPVDVRPASLRLVSGGPGARSSSLPETPICLVFTPPRGSRARVARHPRAALSPAARG